MFPSYFNFQLTLKKALSSGGGKNRKIPAFLQLCMLQLYCRGDIKISGKQKNVFLEDHFTFINYKVHFGVGGTPGETWLISRCHEPYKVQGCGTGEAPL